MLQQKKSWVSQLICMPAFWSDVAYKVDAGTLIGTAAEPAQLSPAGNCSMPKYCHDVLLSHLWV